MYRLYVWGNVADQMMERPESILLIIGFSLLLFAGLLAATITRSEPYQLLGKVYLASTALLTDRDLEAAGPAGSGSSGGEAFRLPNGNALVRNGDRGLVEIDQGGQVVWRYVGKRSGRSEGEVIAAAPY